MEFRCFNGRNNCDYCSSCHSEFKARTSDEKRKIYNQALKDLLNKVVCLRVYDNDLCLEDLIKAKEELWKE